MLERGGSLSKNPTPSHARTTSTTTSASKSPQKMAKTSCRKPFQAYVQSTSTPSRASQLQSSSRQGHHSQESPRHSRASSPAAFYGHETSSLGPSPVLQNDERSSPAPPPPPPHRITRSGHSPTPSSYNFDAQDPWTPRTTSPIPPSPGLMGHTPPFLRDAMDDVMSSLHDMGLQEGDASPPGQSPMNPWSPESFRPINTRTPKRRNRPRSSLGIAGEDIEDNPSQQASSDRTHWDLHDNGLEPQGDQYVERMQSRLRKMKSTPNHHELFLPEANDHDIIDVVSIHKSKAEHFDRPRSVLRKGRPEGNSTNSAKSANRLRNRKSAYELGRGMLTRTFTTKSSATSSSSGARSTSTNDSASTQLTSQSLMSGSSAGCVSATSAGSLARRRDPQLSRPVSVMDLGRSGQNRVNGSQSAFGDRPQTPLTGVTYHSSHDSRSGASTQEDWVGSVTENGGALGGLTAPKPKRSGFFKKMIESGKTAAASARSSIAVGQATPAPTPLKSMLPSGVTSISGGNPAREMGLGGGNTAIDWVQVRRDVNRSNSLSKNERADRQERCQMMDFPVIYPVDVLYDSVEGDEDGEGHPVREPTDFQAVNLTLVDKSARFINSLPPMTNPISLAQGYVCRPYRSDVQRLRSIFIWTSEKIAWEEDVEGDADSRRVIQTKRGCAKEVAVFVMEMCNAVGIHAEIVQGYLKTPGEPLELDTMPHPNHWWNAVLVDGEWRMMDCSLASPTNPRRSLYTSISSQQTESWWFLTRPIEICYTHIPLALEQQHLCPPIDFDVLLGLPCACPPYFRNQLRMVDYDTSVTKMEELEIAHVHFSVPADIECVAEVEAKAFSQDADGDYFENGEVVRKRALAQAEWVGGIKRYTVKALLPGDEGYGVLKVYAGKRGLMVSSFSISGSIDRSRFLLMISILSRTTLIRSPLPFQSCIKAKIHRTSFLLDTLRPMHSVTIFMWLNHNARGSLSTTPSYSLYVNIHRHFSRARDQEWHPLLHPVLALQCQ